MFGPRGYRECAQNDAMGCGNTSDNRQTQFWELHFSDRHLNMGPTPLFHVPTNLPWQLRPNHSSHHVVDGSTCLQLGHSGFLPSSTWTPKLGPRPLSEPRAKILILSEPLPILSLTQYCYSRTQVRGDYVFVLPDFWALDIRARIHLGQAFILLECFLTTIKT